MIIEKRRYGSTSGFVWHMTIRKSQIDAFDENHLCPLMTHSSPSRTALVVSSVGSAPAPGSVIEKHERSSPDSSGSQPLLLLLGRSSMPTAISSALPESGALLPKIEGAYTHAPRISCMRPSRT